MLSVIIYEYIEVCHWVTQPLSRIRPEFSIICSSLENMGSKIGCVWFLRSKLTLRLRGIFFFMFKSCSMGVSDSCCFLCLPELGNVFHVAFLDFLGGKVAPLSGMGICTNTQSGKTEGTWSPVKVSSDIGASGCGVCKNSCFSGICWRLMIYKKG